MTIRAETVANALEPADRPWDPQRPCSRSGAVRPGPRLDPPAPVAGDRRRSGRIAHELLGSLPAVDDPSAPPVPEAPLVSVVGAGQLARMTAPPAVGLGIRLRVLAESPEESAAQVVPDVMIGAPDDVEALARAARGAAALTFDHEHVPGDALRELVARGVAVHPGPDALVHAQDKLVLRRRLDALGVAGPRWAAVASVDELARFGEAVGWPVVLKTPRGGYDGHGVRVVEADAVGATQDWFDRAGGDELLVEERVAFDRELAVVVARSPSGQAAAWTVVETVQVDGVCHEVVAPAPGLDEEVAEHATATALRLAHELGVTGVMAVECFEVPGGADRTGGGAGGSRVLVNELAMRPHNSGHWSIDGSTTSQFEQHLRAVLDLPLGSTVPTAPWSVMVNVLGPRRAEHADLHRALLHVMAHDPGVKVHLYGKAWRPGRKMGHVTVTGADLDEVRARARHAGDFMTGLIDG